MRRTRAHGSHPWRIALAILAAVTAGTMTAVVWPRPAASTAVAPAPDRTVARVGTAAITTAELAAFMPGERSTVVAENPAVSADPAAWYRPATGNTPAAQLTDRALTDAARLQTELRLADQLQLHAPVTYAQFQAARLTENARRAAAIANRQPIYGPRQYSPDAWLIYASGELEFQLQTALAGNGIIATDTATLRRYYRAHTAEYGPNYTAAAEQVRLAVIHDGFTRYLAHQLEAQPVEPTAAYQQLQTAACVAAGDC